MDEVAELRRYAELIAAAISTPTFAPTLESATSVQVERGQILIDGAPTELVDRISEPDFATRLPQMAVIDSAGHHRPVYRALLAHAWLQAFSNRYETLPREIFGRWEETLRPWCDLLEAEVGRITVSDQSNGAQRGASLAEAAWSALALQLAGRIYVRDAWTDLASDTFGRICRAQQPSGAFLATNNSINPETTWYHELCILHAAAGYSVRAEDRNTARAVARAGEFHLAETQPDHATSQPWGLFAFIWNPQTRSLADQLLHTASMNRSDGVSLILLADTLYCLRLFL
jgi:hypothetical protein